MMFHLQELILKELLMVIIYMILEICVALNHIIIILRKLVFLLKVMKRLLIDTQVKLKEEKKFIINILRVYSYIKIV